MRFVPFKFDPFGEIFALAALIFIGCGAMYFGLASCGGYVWHKELFRFSAATLAIGAVIAPSKRLHSIGRKVSFLLTLVVGYFVIEAAIAPFYIAPFGSLREYGHFVIHSLEFGPC